MKFKLLAISYVLSVIHGAAQTLITAPPFHQAVEVGVEATLRVGVAGNGTPSYQWRRADVDLPDATNATLRLLNIQSSNAGPYTVVVSDGSGSSTSRVAHLDVHWHTLLFGLTNRWKFDQSGRPIDRQWKELDYDDSGWPEGAGLFYHESRSLPAPKTTSLALTNGLGQPINTYYFRTHFAFSGDPEGILLVGTNMVDDGAVFYLNGQEVGRLRLPTGVISADVPASVAPEGKFNVILFSASGLKRGDNVMAVEVHRESATDDDVVFGLALKATTLAPLMPDLTVARPPGSHIEQQNFASDSCEVLEGCATPGNRRLLRFDIGSVNQGTGSLVLGNPALDPQFEFDSCHGHYHFDDFVDIRLLDVRGEIVSAGKKIGFALADVDRWDTTNGPPAGNIFGDDNQGIQPGWTDIYSYIVPCQYVDITDTPPGIYTLELEIDPEHKLTELDEENNVTRITVEIPANWVPCATPPANDQFAAARILPPETTSATGTVECATLEEREPGVLDRWGNRASRSVWFRWTSPMTGHLTLDTAGSDFPTVLAFYRGTALDSLLRLGFDVDFRGPGRTSRVMSAVTAGESYAIAVCGYYDARPFVQRDTSGNFVLNLVVNTNDTFASAQRLDGLAGTVFATNVGAGKEAGEPNHAGNLGGRSLWYVWTAPRDGTVTFDTFGSTFNREWGVAGNTFDTLLAAYSGRSIDSLTLVAANDDATTARVSRVSFDAVVGATYYIAVDGRTAATGFCQLNWGPRLSMEGANGDGRLTLTLKSEARDRCIIERSFNMLDWVPWQQVTNVLGFLRFQDPAVAVHGFYRARIE